MLKGQLSVPRQTIYKIKQETKIRKIAYEEIEAPNHVLYVMVDEKWIHEQEDKKAFIKEMDKLIGSKEKESRKQKITEYKNYILKHWKGIINMKNSLCKSSMESHIQHCMASAFSSVPKGYSRKNIEIYIKLQEMFLNGVSIFEYYLDTYNSDENYEFNNEKEVNYSIFESSTSNMPILSSSSNVSHALHNFIY